MIWLSVTRPPGVDHLLDGPAIVGSNGSHHYVFAQNSVYAPLIRVYAQ